MPGLLTDRLTDDLYRRFSGADIESLACLAITVCTLSADGWPHPAMLSYFEVAAVDRHNLRLAVYRDSRTCANMRDRGKATLIVVDAGLVCYISGQVTPLAPAMHGAPYNAILNLRVGQVQFDEPSPELESGVAVTSGITHSARTAAALARAHRVLAELREPRRDDGAA